MKTGWWKEEKKKDRCIFGGLNMLKRSWLIYLLIIGKANDCKWSYVINQELICFSVYNLSKKKSKKKQQHTP